MTGQRSEAQSAALARVLPAREGQPQASGASGEWRRTLLRRLCVCAQPDMGDLWGCNMVRVHGFGFWIDAGAPSLAHAPGCQEPKKRRQPDSKAKARALLLWRRVRAIARRTLADRCSSRSPVPALWRGGSERALTLRRAALRASCLRTRASSARSSSVGGLRLRRCCARAADPPPPSASLSPLLLLLAPSPPAPSAW